MTLSGLRNRAVYDKIRLKLRKVLIPLWDSSDKRKREMRKFFSCIFFAFVAGVVNADIVYSINGSTLTVTASAAYADRGLKLLWDSADKGSSTVNWSNSATITHSVPSVGGTYTVNLAELGISVGTPCRVASYMNFSRLNALKQSGFKSYTTIP
jgi:hypothetical protein